mmetsp:Transcript_9778/g.17670  ORF Transcript_9778/g.17670 Transcript_9778/m.17670 type:complete len:82 (-) Transcript_9778:968-1213(-)
MGLFVLLPGPAHCQSACSGVRAACGSVRGGLADLRPEDMLSWLAASSPPEHNDRSPEQERDRAVRQEDSEELGESGQMRGT